MAYNIYLSDRGLPGSNIPDDLRQSTASDLRNWFQDVMDLTNPRWTEGVEVRWVDTRPQMQPNEILIFFVQSQRFSIVRHMRGINMSNQTLSGLTGWSQGFTCSEVYIDYGTRFFRQIAFHEALHNKTHFGNQGMHRRGGLAASGLNDPDAVPTPQNKALMAQHILTPKPQWLDGFRY